MRGEGFKGGAFGGFGVGDGAKDAAEEPVYYGGAVAEVNGHGFGFGAEGGFGFEGGAAEGEAFAAPVDGGGNGGVEEAEVNGDAGGGGFAIESDVIADGGVAVAEGGDEAEDLVVAADDGAGEIVAEGGGEFGEIFFGGGDEADGGVVDDVEIEFVEAAGVGPEVVDAFDDAAGGGEFFGLVFGVAAIFGVEGGEVIVVGSPLGIEIEDHVGLGFHGAVAPAFEAVEGGLRGGDVFDHHEIVLAGDAVGAAEAMEGIGDAGPEVGGIGAGRESDAVKAPAEEVAGDEDFLLNGFFEEFDAAGFVGVFDEIGGGDGNDLGGDGGDGFGAAAEEDVAGLDVGGAVLLDVAEKFAAEEDALAAGDAIPAGGIEEIDAIGEGEMKFGGRVAFFVAGAGVAEFVDELAEGINFEGHWEQNS